jgi:predicted RNA-binding Zn ribbon-like protein
VLVQAFVNTHFDLVERWGEEALRSPPALTGWLARRGLIGPGDAATGADLERALAVREGLRALASAHRVDRTAAIDQLNAATAALPVRVVFEAAGPRLHPTAPGSADRALALIVAIVYGAMLDGDWGRLKACPGHHCGWLFYDGSRNNSGRWCSMSVCGGRAKARAHYQRQRDGSN